jgi:hypothetical protein
LVFSNTFNNISVISWQSFLFFEETEYMQKIIDLLQVTDKLRAIPFKYTWEEGTSLISDPPSPPPIEEDNNFHPPPPEFTSINTPLPPEKKNHKNNFLYRNTQS